MSLTDIIGFLGSFGLFIFLMLRQAYQQRQQKAHPEYEEERLRREDAQLQAYLEDLELDEDEIPRELRPVKVKPKPQPKPVRPPPMPQSVFKRPIPTQDFAPRDQAYDIIVKDTSSKAERLLKDSPNLKDMVIYHEIFGPPKALQDPYR